MVRGEIEAEGDWIFCNGQGIEVHLCEYEEEKGCVFWQ